MLNPQWTNVLYAIFFHKPFYGTKLIHKHFIRGLVHYKYFIRLRKYTTTDCQNGATCHSYCELQALTGVDTEVSFACLSWGVKCFSNREKNDKTYKYLLIYLHFKIHKYSGNTNEEKNLPVNEDFFNSTWYSTVWCLCDAEGLAKQSCVEWTRKWK